MRFYSWVVLGIITLIEGFSGFGRTSAFSPFLKDICHDLTLTLAQISGAYTLANLCSGAFLPIVGRSYDKRTPSFFLFVHVALFGGAFIVLSTLKFLNMVSFFNFLALFIGFTCIRTAVHAYTVAGRSIIAVCFKNKKGLATGLSCFFLTTIASTMPWINLRLHDYFDWQQIWIVVGVFWILIAGPVCFFIKIPTFGNKPKKKRVKTKLNKAIYKESIFWLIMAALFFKAMQNTGIALHLIDMCKELGTSAEKVALYMIVISGISSLTIFVAGHYFEKLGIRGSLLLFLSADLLFLIAFRCITLPYMNLLFVAFCGLYWGMNQIIAYMVLPKIFGTGNIGAINGLASAFICWGSSVGPSFLGLMKTYDTYKDALAVFIVVATALILWSLIIFKKIKPLAF